MKAVFLDRGTFPTQLKLNPPTAVTEWKEYENTNNDQRKERCQNAQVILVNKVILDRELIESLTELQLICVTATGVNNVDLAACRDRGIKVFNATDYGTQSVAEHVVMMMLALARHLKTYLNANQNKLWSKSPFFCDLQAPMQTLAGKQLTIVGRGTLGTAVAELAQAFKMNVCFAEHRDAEEIRAGYTEFKEALTTADFISLHCPLNESTRNMLDDKLLNQLKTGACLINAGRGGLVDEAALYDALTQNKLAGAAMDVTITEPPGENDAIWRLESLPNVLCTPHIAWAADEAMQTLIKQIIDKIDDWSYGREVPNLAV